MTKPKPYVTNAELLREIHKSKNTFCEFVDSRYEDYDLIVTDVAEINGHTQEVALINRKKRLKTPVVLREDCVFRCMTAEHIPLDPERKNKAGTRHPEHQRTNFHPFKHYIIENSKLREVGRSHSLNGEFSQDHGTLTAELARMLLLMVEKYGMKYNWNRYTYLSEMRGEAMVHLAQNCLMFDEANAAINGKQQNPFAYLTQVMKNAFLRILNIEKRNQDIRDDLCQAVGLDASHSRQLDHEYENAMKRQDW